MPQTSEKTKRFILFLQLAGCGLGALCLIVASIMLIEWVGTAQGEWWGFFTALILLILVVSGVTAILANDV